MKKAKTKYDALENNGRALKEKFVIPG